MSSSQLLAHVFVILNVVGSLEQSFNKGRALIVPPELVKLLIWLL
jgi:hypothetical protein